MYILCTFVLQKVWKLNNFNESKRQANSWYISELEPKNQYFLVYLNKK